jgi:N-acetylglucosaminyldiphosphoundecaprenol N-acetyl-beta-D-mannosaminyltransferase
MTFPPKYPIVGVPISTTSYDEVFDALDARPGDKATVVAVCNVHSVMNARRDPALNEAISAAEIATSDGVPLVWALRWTVRPEQERVYGPELMRRAFAEEGERGWKHFLYGSTPDTLQLLEQKIREFSPEADIVGIYSPPFRQLTAEEQEATLEEIRASGADLVWVGLGMPKQELWMHRVRPDLPGIAVLGVGAAFDFLAGTVKQAPGWMQRAGLEWLYRLIQEPRRLWRRYLFNNPTYMVLLAFQVLKVKLGRVVKRKQRS